MKEIRLHGRGGQGVVKSAQTVVQTVVDTGAYAHFIPFFGVERKGSPVFGFLRINDKDIRIKTQVYNPDVLIILDDSLVAMDQTFMGLKEDGIVIINTTKNLKELGIHSEIKNVYTVDASKIALENIKLNIPNTAILGAFAKATNLVDWPELQEHIKTNFGEANRLAAIAAYDQVQLINN